MRKLNVGCGPHHIREGFINMDLRPFERVDEVRDATIPFDDLGPLSHIFSEHFLEHLQIDGALKFLRNCLTALAPRGRLRLATPSLEFVMLTHFNPAETDESRMIASTFAINRAFHGWGHQYLWSSAMIKKSLTACGFIEIEQYEYGLSKDKSFQGIELHPGYRIERGFPNVWIFEATRPTEIVNLDSAFADLVELEFLRHVRSGH